MIPLIIDNKEMQATRQAKTPIATFAVDNAPCRRHSTSGIEVGLNFKY